MLFIYNVIICHMGHLIVVYRSIKILLSSLDMKYVGGYFMCLHAITRFFVLQLDFSLITVCGIEKKHDIISRFCVTMRYE